MLQHKLLARLHVVHMCQSRTLAPTKAKYFWPKMRDKNIIMVQQCSVCIKYACSMPMEEEIVQSSASLSSHPMEQVGPDFFHLNG